MDWIDRELTRWGKLLSFQPGRGVRLSARDPWQSFPEALSGLSTRLYHGFYGGHAPSRLGRLAGLDARVTGDLGFVAEIGACTAGLYAWETGWSIHAKADGEAIVTNSILYLWLTDGEWRPREASAGQGIEVRLPCARPSHSAGFFYFVSRCGRIPAERPHVRLYLNVTAQGALALLRELATNPELAELRFEAKVVNDPRFYNRRDTAVVYVEPEIADKLTAFALRFRTAHPSLVRPKSPPFTESLAPGVSIAEGLNGSQSVGQSFGEQRCRLMAVGILEALRRKEPPELWRAQVATVFARQGLSLTHPAFERLTLHRDGDRIRLMPRADQAALDPPP